LLLAACTDLPNIPSGECGNAVIESGEDCDTFAPLAHGVCRPPGSAGECHLDCRITNEGTRPACFPGWGCNADGICSPPSGGYETATHFDVGAVTSLSAADLDGDGRADLVSREPLDALQEARFSTHYFDASGSLAATRVFPKRIGAPVLRDISDDGLADFVFTKFPSSASGDGVDVLRGRADRGFVPDTFGSYVAQGTKMRVVSVLERGRVGTNSGLVVIAEQLTNSNLYIPDVVKGKLALKAVVDGLVSNLAGDPVSGPIVEGAGSPCAEIVLGFLGERSFPVFDMCGPPTTTGEPTWRAQANVQLVTLEPAAAIDHAPVIGDLNDDGHADVLIGAGGVVYAAYGDGKQLGTAKPFLLHNSNEVAIKPELPMPVAVGEFSGDSFPDFVFPTVILSSFGADASGLPIYNATQQSTGAPWTVARVADVNRDGFTDVVAASDSGFDIDFFNGTGGPLTAQSRIPTRGPVRQLVLGDFDGDLLSDVAFLEDVPNSGAGSSLAIAWGQSAGPPLGAQVVAQVDGAVQMCAFGDGAFSGLMVSASQQRTDGPNAVLTLLDGSTDRLPFAPLELVSFPQDNSLVSSAALALSVGEFAQHGRHDALVLGTKDAQVDFTYWLLAGINDPRLSPLRLDIHPDPSLLPTFVLPSSMEKRLSVSGTAADLDRDGFDEALWAMPTNDQLGCGFEWFSLAADGVSLGKRGLVTLPSEPCADPELLAADVDGDGFVDVALFTGQVGIPGRLLHVLWNDGSGGFSASNSSLVNVSGDSPEAFSFLPRTALAVGAFAYVTSGALVLRRVNGDRQFDTLNLDEPPALSHGTGIVAADVDGDGVPDLAVADSGDLLLLKGQLQPR